MDGKPRPSKADVIAKRHSRYSKPAIPVDGHQSVVIVQENVQQKGAFAREVAICALATVLAMETNVLISNWVNINNFVYKNRIFLCENTLSWL